MKIVSDGSEFIIANSDISAANDQNPWSPDNAGNVVEVNNAGAHMYANVHLVQDATAGSGETAVDEVVRVVVYGRVPFGSNKKAWGEWESGETEIWVPLVDSSGAAVLSFPTTGQAENANISISAPVTVHLAGALAIKVLVTTAGTSGAVGVQLIS